MIDYEALDEMHEVPQREPIRKNGQPVNSHAVLLKRTESALNRFRKNGVIK